MKESCPLETAEFPKVRGIHDEAALGWCVPYTLKKSDAIFSAMRTHVQKTTHKNGIELPTSVEHAKEINNKNKNTMRMDALANEMFNVGMAFEVLDEGQRAPSGWYKVTGHLTWVVKMNFSFKAWWVFDGHKTPNLVGTTFAGVISQESISLENLGYW